MKKKYSIFILLFVLFVSSCNDFGDNVSSIKGLAEQSKPLTRSMGDAKSQVLGYGYDITGEYLARKSIKKQVLNIDSFISDNPSLYKVEYAGEISDYTYFGEDYMSYIKEIIRKNKYSGSIAEGASKTDKEDGKIPYAFSASYNEESVNRSTITTKETYGRIDQTKNLEQYLLYSDPKQLSNYLTAYFKKQLETITPDEIVKEFGTHVLIDITVGGSLSTYYKSTITDNIQYDSKTKIAEAGASYALKKIGLSFSSSSSTQEIEQYQKKNSNWICQIIMRGGQHDGHKITITSDGVYNHTIDLSEWQKSIDSSHCALTEINFEKTYPIYEFIKDPVKKEQIKNAVNKYISSQIVPIIKVKPMYQLKSTHTKDTWWAYSKDEVNYAINKWGEEYQGVLGFVLTEPSSSTKPMYRMKSTHTKDTWYAFDYGTVQYAISKWGEQYGGIDGYLYASEQINTRPLYRLKSTHTKDTWYTCDFATVQYAQDKWGEEYQGIDGYIIKP